MASFWLLLNLLIFLQLIDENCGQFNQPNGRSIRNRNPITTVTSLFRQMVSLTSTLIMKIKEMKFKQKKNAKTYSITSFMNDD